MPDSAARTRAARKVAAVPVDSAAPVNSAAPVDPPAGVAPGPVAAPAENDESAVVLSPEREICARCRRPVSVCFCSYLPNFEPHTRVVFLQHPRERRVAISTCRMAHLAFAGSELHHGVIFDGDAAIESIAREDDGAVAVLFPGEGAIDPRSLPPGRLKTLFVVDGTWSQAKKLIARNKVFAGMPRLGLSPSRPSNYRIRREPDEQSVSTIEAVVEVLGLLEGDPERYRAALGAFDHMIDPQIARRDARVGPARYKRKRERMPKKEVLPAELLAGASRAVIFYIESNAYPDADGTRRLPELLQLLAVRPATGERFEALVKTRRPLGESVPRHVGLPAEVLRGGEPVDGALDRFAKFTGDSLLLGWGRFGYELWRREADVERWPFVDLRVLTSKRLKRRAGGIEPAIELLGLSSGRPWSKGRAGRRIAALESIFRSIIPL